MMLCTSMDITLAHTDMCAQKATHVGAEYTHTDTSHPSKVLEYTPADEDL